MWEQCLLSFISLSMQCLATSQILSRCCLMVFDIFGFIKTLLIFLCLFLPFWIVPVLVLNALSFGRIWRRKICWSWQIISLYCKKDWILLPLLGSNVILVENSQKNENKLANQDLFLYFWNHFVLPLISLFSVSFNTNNGAT